MRSWTKLSQNYLSSAVYHSCLWLMAHVNRYGNTQNMSQVTVTGQTFADLLSVSVQHLDSEAEMRKFFGSKIVQANQDASSAAGPSRRKAAAIRSQLTRPQATWWSAKGREGLSIRLLTDGEVDDKLERHGWDPMAQEKWWTVEYSKRYKSLTKVFMGTVLSGGEYGGKLVLTIINNVFRSSGVLGHAWSVSMACRHTPASIGGLSTSRR